MPQFKTTEPMGKHFSDHFGLLARASDDLPNALARRAHAPLLKMVQVVFGKRPALQELAPSTQAERLRLGFKPNDPLLRTGSLRASYRSAAVGESAQVGSPDPRAKWHEHGYINPRAGVSVPPRPVLMVGLASMWKPTRALMIAAIKRFLR